MSEDAIIEKEQISEELAPQEILGENPITLQNIIIIKQEEYGEIKMNIYGTEDNHYHNNNGAEKY